MFEPRCRKSGRFSGFMSGFFSWNTMCRRDSPYCGVRTASTFVIRDYKWSLCAKILRLPRRWKHTRILPVLHQVWLVRLADTQTTLPQRRNGMFFAFQKHRRPPDRTPVAVCIRQRYWFLAVFAATDLNIVGWGLRFDREVDDLMYRRLKQNAPCTAGRFGTAGWINERESPYLSSSSAPIWSRMAWLLSILFNVNASVGPLL